MTRTQAKKGSQAPELAFGQHLRQMREQKGLSQERLAAAAGIAKDSIRRYESGLQSPNLKIVRKLAEALEVSPGLLIPSESA